MTDVLVLGATGMLGHALLRTLSPMLDAVGTVRGATSVYNDHPAIGPVRLISGITVDDSPSIERALHESRPKLVVNCIGAVKQSASGQDPVAAIKFNALFPHELALICARYNSRLIHISTDCVFSGRRGNYRETDNADATDLYGLSKLLGELDRPGCLTLRTSLIGREIRERRGLVEWFLSNRGGTTKGFTRAIFSGITTVEMARVVARIIERAPDLEGIWHLAADPIDKYSLLKRIDTAFATRTTIVADDTFVCDRSLDGTAFRRRLDYAPPSWDAMIDELAHSAAHYELP